MSTGDISTTGDGDISTTGTVTSTVATDTATVVPPVVPIVAQTLKLYTVIDGIEHHGILELEPTTRTEQIINSASLGTFFKNIDKIIDLIPERPTLDGHIKILNALEPIQKNIESLSSTNFNYNVYNTNVDYTHKIIAKVNKILEIINNSKNNKPGYFQKYNEALQKLQALCDTIIKIEPQALNGIKLSKPTDFISRNNEITQTPSRIDSIKKYITSNKGGNAKTHRKRLRRRRSTYRKHI
jgi:hypothetical protein